MSLIASYIILYMFSLYFVFKQYIEDFRELTILSLIGCLLYNISLSGLFFMLISIISYIKQLEYSWFKKYNIILYKRRK